VSGDDYDAYIAARKSGLSTSAALESIGQPGQATVTHPFESLQNSNVNQQSSGR
jgi:cytochrome c oxidase subunit 2